MEKQKSYEYSLAYRCHNLKVGEKVPHGYPPDKFDNLTKVVSNIKATAPVPMRFRYGTKTIQRIS